MVTETESWPVAGQFPGGQFACNSPSTKSNTQTHKQEKNTEKMVMTNTSSKMCKEYKDALY